MHCCFLSTDDLGDYVTDDEMAVEPLRDLGWDVETVPWKSDCDWGRFDVVVVRTTWDYHHEPETFCRRLKEIHDSNAILENSLNSIVWNIEKTYLEDLARAGIRIVPTVYGGKAVDQESLEIWMDYFECDELVIKPTISATATNTFRFNSLGEELDIFKDIPYLVQPFIKSIIEEGEISLFYFDGDYSHSIAKRPGDGDFRVQEEFGGINESVKPEPAMREFGQLVIDVLPETPLYARVDVVKDLDGQLALMELELIEPALYFRYDHDAPNRFAEALDRRFNEL